jgi:hypothetical protein
MLGKIKTVKSIAKALSYNEQKLTNGKAESLLAENFIKDLAELSREDKLDHFRQLTSLNERSKANTLHISVNFGPEEKISNKQMQELARRYMRGIGFEEQPYLVYRHYDAAHPHFHIVSTNIQPDGNRIILEKKQIYRSHQLSSQLEKEFSLQPYHRANWKEEEKFKVRHARRVNHGEMPLQRSISDVLNTVIDHYKYSNLTELNAILRLYNLKADRGEKSSRMYQNKGLVYYALDENGHKAGKGINASCFLLKPTLKKLEEKFALNKTLQQEHRQRVTTAIDWTLAGQAPDWTRFQEDLEKERISVVVQAEKNGQPGGIFFVDHEAKCAWSGHSLGKHYLLESIQAQCAQEQQALEEKESLRHRHRFDL